jgi:hypothetical protein
VTPSETPLSAKIAGVSSASGRVKALGIALIVVTGLLTFHPPHFLLEAGRHPNNTGASVLEIALAINLVAALIAALAIWRNARWGWSLGIVIALVAIGLYLAQQTIGLPGLPKNWVEPSRIVSLVVQTLFIAVAVRQLRQHRPIGNPGTPP